jgi:PHP family Zn ribbon phosphoesterase
LYTIEFFPEEGMYHFDGHRNCNVRLAPEESLKLNKHCPNCQKPLTIGVMHRVNDLADREDGFIPDNSIGVKHLVPLAEIIAESLGQKTGTKAVENEYQQLVNQYGSEISVLIDHSLDELSKFAPAKIVDGIKRVREGRIKVEPGYDGVYGTVKVFGVDDEQKASAPQQASLF